MNTDESGRYSAMYKPYHLIGLELNISILSVVLRARPTGAATVFNADVVAIAKRDINPGETLDGEGGYTVWGRIMPATDSVATSALPIGLANGVKVSRPVKQGQLVTVDAVDADFSSQAWHVRGKMMELFAPDRR
jgi:predicted homoserine dehydrogenase-like protein